MTAELEQSLVDHFTEKLNARQHQTGQMTRLRALVVWGFGGDEGAKETLADP